MTGSTGARLWAKARPETVAAASEARKARRSMNICNSSPMGGKLSRRLVLTATPWGRPGAISGGAWQTRHNSLSLAAAWGQAAASVCFVGTSQLLILEKKRVSEMDVGVPARACTACILVLAAPL